MESSSKATYGGHVANWQGFWSYVHDDDEAENGRIQQLARDVVSQFELMSGESILLFLDRDAIEWGHDWKENIDNSLESVAFFIAILTPRYFMSAECRRELQFFARKATKLGMKDLILPVHYSDVPQLDDDNDADELVKLVRTFQWEDWRDLRLSDRESASYRTAVARLARRLIEANRKQSTSIKRDVGFTSQTSSASEELDDAPGVIDLVAAAEQALPQVTDSLHVISTEIEIIGSLMKEGTEQVRLGDNAGKGYAARLLIARKLASRLKAPVEKVELSANEYASRLHEVDQGFRIVIDQTPDTIKANPDAKKDVCGFFVTVKKMATSAHDAFLSTRGMVDTIEPLEKLSRDLRPPLRRLRQALTIMLEGREVIDEWVKLIESTGINCDGLKLEWDV